MFDHVGQKVVEPLDQKEHDQQCSHLMESCKRIVNKTLTEKIMIFWDIIVH